MGVEMAKNSLMGGGKNRFSPLDRDKYTDKDRQAYEAYKKDFATDVATGKYGDKNRAPLSMDHAYRIGFKSPAQSKLALKSASRGHGREDVDPNTGRSATRALSDGDRKALGLEKDFKQTGRVMAAGGGVSPVQRKKKRK